MKMVKVESECIVSYDLNYQLSKLDVIYSRSASLANVSNFATSLMKIANE